MQHSRIKSIQKFFSLHQIQNFVMDLHEMERKASYNAYDASTRYCMDMLKLAGFQQIERLTHRCDGKTSAFDCIMPEAWDLTGRSTLRIVSGGIPEYEALLADTDRNFQEVTTYSGPTPEGGITGEVVDSSQLDSEHPDVAGKWIFMTGHGSDINGIKYRKAAEAGAAGLILTDFSVADIAPDDVFWFNGQGLNSWYHEKEAPRLPVFSIAPRRAKNLLELMKKGKVLVHGEIHARIYDGKIYTVTGIIPGESKEEYLLLAHVYEPFIADDALGFGVACELGRILTARKTRLKKTLRVVFSMELYGFAAYFADAENRKNAAAALSLDSFCHLERNFYYRLSPICNPYFTDWFYPDWYQKNLPHYILEKKWGSLSDDTFLSDPATNIPTNWIYMPSHSFHHNTGHYFTPDWKILEEIFPVFAGALETLLILDVKEDYAKRALKEFRSAAGEIIKKPELSNYERHIRLNAEYLRCSKMLESWSRFSGQPVDTAGLKQHYETMKKKLKPWQNDEFNPAEYRAMNLTVERLVCGCPFSLAGIPYAERKFAPMEQALWGLFDGKRNLLECIRMLDNELPGRKTTDKAIIQIMNNLKYYEKYGYVRLLPAVTVTKNQAKDALKRLGIKSGMKLIVHSKFSSLGTVEGGAAAFCEALMETIGMEGTLLMPAFTFDIYEGKRFGEPFDYCNSRATTGVLSETFRKMTGVKRSADPCHSYCAWGARATEFVKNHHKVPTVSEKSPLGLLEKEDGWCLTISAMNAVTFMHVVESSFGARCLGIRTEEYPAILADGRKVKLRTWSWRSNTCPECPANRENELFQIMRDKGFLREASLGNAHLCLFRLSDYRHIYEKMLKQCKCLQQNCRPRKVAFSVKSDWDAGHGRLKPSHAFTGELPGLEN